MSEFNLRYCLRKIGVRSGELRNDNDTIFKYRGKTFKKLFNFDFSLLQSDIFKNKDFALHVISSAEYIPIEYVGLFLIPRRVYANWASRSRLIAIGFEFSEEFQSFEICEENIAEESCNRFYITSQLYDFLRKAHINEQLDKNIPKSVQHIALKPSLRAYQVKAIQWMWHREKATEILPNDYNRIYCKDIPEQKFFINARTLDIIDFEPVNITLPTGGILADEMGLGKTVEMLALILLNQRPVNEINQGTCGILQNDRPVRKKRRIQVLHCVCTNKLFKNTIQCTECFQIQHRKCVRKFSKVVHKDENYICPKCWRNKPLIESGSTIIVSPHSIKMQWNSEIEKHISKNIRVLIYDSFSDTGWISPQELADYDLVLTDYNVLKKEIYFSNTNESTCNLRNQKKYIKINSPLVSIRWWRVCLDEAQMVESSTTKAAQMVQTLPTIHRWAVTGTPIQKSVDDLRGVLEFLEASPFYEKDIWGFLVASFQKGKTEPLLHLLSKLMWRTCKGAVLKELNIPAQTEEVHYVTMSDVQMLFYRGQHYSCAFAFEQKVQKHASSSDSLSKIDTRTLKIILEPLRKLRQDCTIPVLCEKSEQSVIKKFLQPQELLDHLKLTNEIDCKSQLRTMVSSLNGMAALHIVRCEFKDAIRLYETVLQKSQQYVGTICVDTILQIHALHNLEIALELSGAPDNTAKLEEYKIMCSKLEWKYIQTYYNNFLKAETSFRAAHQLVFETEEKLDDTDGECWSYILSEIEEQGCITQLLTKINDEKRLTFGSTLYNNFTLSEGVDYALTIWYEKVINTREKVLEEFENFKQYTDNIKPETELPEEVQEQMILFNKLIFDCHLNNSKKKKTEGCNLCKAAQILTTYECLIFNKVLDSNDEKTEGSRNPTYQETILRILISFAKSKRIRKHYLQNGETFLQLINCLKEEYKKLIKLWIEIEYTVKAYHELDMCKMRLQVVDSMVLEEKENKSIYEIPSDNVESTFMELQLQLKQAESEFARKLGRLNYIKHLECSSDPGICPICKHEPDKQYAVLECGHHLCMMCITGMMKFQRRILTCAVCRNVQRHEDAYFVTRKPKPTDNDEIVVHGYYSSKIEEIVRTVLILKLREETVKILIFSHWEPILGEIGKALKENQILYRSKATVKCISEFKNDELGITCLLLPLASGGKGLNLIEATHVFLVEPILNPGEELQAIGRIHRIGQIRPTTVHRFIVRKTIEEKIFDTISNDKTGKWQNEEITISNIKSLFALD